MLPNAQPKPQPRILDKMKARREEIGLKRRVYAEVDTRDLRCCRCCGRRGNPDSVTALGKIHRAHIVDASRGGQISSENLISLCSLCHSFEHAKQLFFRSKNANSMKFAFDVHEAAVLDIFGARQLPSHVHIITGRR